MKEQPTLLVTKSDPDLERQQNIFLMFSAIDGNNGLQEYHNQRIENIREVIAIAKFFTGSIDSSNGHNLHPCVVITEDTPQIPQTGPVPLLLHLLPARQFPENSKKTLYCISTAYVNMQMT